MYKWLGITFLFVFLSIIKLHNYDRTPFPSHAEELGHAWSGIFLLETGVPVSWSSLDYPKENIFRDGLIGDKNNLHLYTKLYKPYLDEPPLYSLMVGAVAHLYGDDRNSVIPPSHSRIPSVLASLVTMLMVFLVGWKFFDLSTGVLAMIFYGTTPMLVFGSRLSVPENIIALGVIISLFLAKIYVEKPKVSIAIFWGVSAALLGLMKPTGYFLAFLAIFIAVSKRQYRHAVIIFILLTLGILAFALYGAHFDWKLFLHIVSIQGGRFAGWTGLGFIFNTPAYDIFIQYDGWYIFAMLSAVFFALSRSKSQPLKLLVLFWFFWLMVAVFSGTEQDLLPWYRYPIFPLLAVFGALGIKWIYEKPEFFGMALTVGTLLTSRFFLHNAFRPQTPALVFRLTYLLALVPSLANTVWPKVWLTKLSRIILIIFFVLGVFFNAKYIYSVFEVTCESITCQFGPSTPLSEIRLPFIWRFFVMGDAHGVLDDQNPWF